MSQLQPLRKRVRRTNYNVADSVVKYDDRMWRLKVDYQAAPGLRLRNETYHLSTDRHWRNARVHTLHDPVRWKYHLLGNYLLNGALPRRHQWN